MNEQDAPQGANVASENGRIQTDAAWPKNLESAGDVPEAGDRVSDGKTDDAQAPAAGQAGAQAPAGEEAAGQDDAKAGVDWEKVDLGVPEDARPELVAAFRGLAAEMNLTPEQARKLAGFEAASVEKIRAAASEEGRRQLAAEWGDRYEAKRVECVGLINAVDLALQQANPKADHAFSKAVERTGAACDPDFVRGLAHIASLMREDSLDAARAATGAVRPETVREGLAGLFK